MKHFVENHPLFFLVYTPAWILAVGIARWLAEVLT
jgi:hypothetical protein